MTIGNHAPATTASIAFAKGRRLARTLPIALLLVVVVACGDEDEESTPTPDSLAATETIAAPSASTSPTTDGSPASTSPVAGTPGSGVPATLGELADRTNAAWASVQSYRVVSTADLANASTPGSPIASPADPTMALLPQEMMEEGIVPDRRHVTTRQGEQVSETISVDGIVYVRGDLALAIRPDVDASTWVAVDPTTLDPQSPTAAVFTALATATTSPYPDLPEAARAREVTPGEPMEIDGRSCDTYRYVDTTETGGRIDVTIAIGTDDRLCSIETIAGGIRSLTQFTYDLPVTIEPPEGAIGFGTPIASPAP